MTHLWRSFTVIALATSLACGIACDSDPRADPAPESSPEIEDTLRDQLSQLGYLDAAPEQAVGDAGVVVHDPARAHAGYGLYTTRSLCLAELIDMEGRVVHSWQEPQCRLWSNAELQPNGDLVVTGMDPANPGSRPGMYLLRQTWDGERVLKVTIGAHHDAEVLADGRFLTLVQKARRIPEIGKAYVLDDAIALVSEDGEILDQLSITDLLRSQPQRVTLRNRKAKRGLGGLETIDLIHANAVEWIEPGQVLFCSQAQDLIGIVDLSSRDLVWVWGQGQLSGPHHPTLLPTGNILVFDNGIEHGRSRAVELDPRTDEIVWTYEASDPSSFFTRSRGSVQRLPNGNTLIANSDEGVAFEVTTGGEIVWEFRTPHLDERGHRATIVRMRRYPPALIQALLARD